MHWCLAISCSMASSAACGQMIECDSCCDHYFQSKPEHLEHPNIFNGFELPVAWHMVPHTHADTGGVQTLRVECIAVSQFQSVPGPGLSTPTGFQCTLIVRQEPQGALCFVLVSAPLV
jgi:hypothetical protein